MEPQNEVYRLKFIVDQLEGELASIQKKTKELKEIGREFKRLSLLLDSLNGRPSPELVEKIERIQNMMERR